jgi:mono/diheme cytochrome c family protein
MMRVRNSILALAIAWILMPVLASADTQTDLIAHGQYVTRAADCEACHTAPGGQPFAGGRAFVLPFGVLYSPNITPDATSGIAGYSAQDWLRMLHKGVGRGGRKLYPAMPYPSYTGLSDADALAIRTYLLSLKPVHADIPANQLSFPFNQRWGMMFWNLLNNSDTRWQPDALKSAEYNRGAYLVEALGHCGECHTPRNFMMALKTGSPLAGAQQAGWLAYNLTVDPVHGIGNWSDADLQAYLSTGQAKGHGPASGPMAEVVEDSLQYLSPADIHAIIVYLRAVPASARGPEAVAADGDPPSGNPLGEQIFQDACAGCHLTNGEGRQSQWAALRGATSIGDPNGTNIIQVLTQGTNIQTSQGTMFMHPFTGAYNDNELAAVGNYAISQFGFRQGRITPDEVAKQRKGQ